MEEQNKKTTNTLRNLITLVVGVLMFICGRLVIVDGLIHDILILAGAVVLPILVFISDLIGVMGGYLIGVHELGFNGGNYMQQTLRYLERSDVNSGLIKAAVFGLIISLMGCYQGYNSERGAEGVGRATTNAVVSASIFILFMNYVLTSILFQR